MDQKINILPESLTNKIAAGEVVERPASVVKELVENALDADADDITVIIRDGGKSLIQVIDNGVGMSPADAVLAFQRHATSKIRDYADLQRVQTLGFRGEALASIASVSRVEMRTVPRGQIEGTLLRLEAGKIVEQGKTGGNPGTSVAVKNLFFNTPARRKFLRATSTEYRYILAVMNRFALAFPEVRFRLVNDDREVFRYAPATAEERAVEVFGSQTRGKLIPVEDISPALTITGFVGTPDTFRRSRGDQYLFVNRRFVVSRSLGHAISSAFEGVLPAGMFPLYVVFLEVDPEHVDVNVHPTKIEVKLWDEGLVYRLLRGAVRRAVTSGMVVPDLSRPEAVEHAAPVPSVDFPQSRPVQLTLPFSYGEEESGAEVVAPPQVQTAPEVVPEGPPSTQARQPMHGVEMWQVHNRYIFTEIRSGVIVIDQHVAHERILYEKALKRFEGRERSPATQVLLFPETLELSLEDFSLFLEIQPFLERLGFSVRVFGARTVVIEGVPSGQKISNPGKALLSIIDEYGKERQANVEVRDSVAKSYACKTAIKSGDRLTLEEMNALVDQLFACEQPYFCPHGRPILIQISLEELDRRFGRE
ncbi:MAG: DNA mismatch repair endonuclease MutL [Calditrichaeota bacterium]|nr:DNA mismatch repair endonuclease MutL [Calditrichota bacterium]